MFLITGDGSFGFYPMELSSAVYHTLPFLALIANDSGWGANRGSQRQSIGRNVGVDFGQDRYDLIAEALQCHGELVEHPTQMARALDRAIEAVHSGRPAVINALVDPELVVTRTPGLQFLGSNPAFERVSQRLNPAPAD